MICGLLVDSWWIFSGVGNLAAFGFLPTFAAARPALHKLIKMKDYAENENAQVAL